MFSATPQGIPGYLPVADNPGGNEVFAVPSEEALVSLMSWLSNQESPNGCDYEVFAQPWDNCNDCIDDGFEPPEGNTYYYYIDCCIYPCPVDTQSSLYPDCINQTYNADDWDIDNPNPN